MMARETILAKALISERERMITAHDVLHDVLFDYRANDEVRAAAIRLIEWLTLPAEKIANESKVRDRVSEASGGERE